VCRETTGKEPRRRPWGRIAGGRAPHETRESLRDSWRREHHRIDVPPIVLSRRDRGFVEPGSVRLHNPYRGWFLDRYGTGGVRAATFFATTPVFREALDHRLLAPTASGVALCPRGVRMWTLVSGYVYYRFPEMNVHIAGSVWGPGVGEHCQISLDHRGPPGAVATPVGNRGGHPIAAPRALSVDWSGHTEPLMCLGRSHWTLSFGMLY
jgi:hypothetical protein